VKYDVMIFKKHWSMAGYDNQRARQINRMFADKTVKAIFCAQAGYGSIRTIPYLDKKIIKENPKIFLGYSDITILLSYIQNVGRMVVFHGPVVAGEMYNEMNNQTLEYLLKVLTEKEPLGEFDLPGIKCLRSGKAEGLITGGNLSLIINTVGTPYDIDTSGKIIFLEDISEDLEVIDRHIMHLKLAGKLKDIKGIIFGKMMDCIDFSGGKYSIKNVLDDILGSLDVPIVYGFPSGHRKQGEVNVTLPLGVSVTIEAGSDNSKIIINEAGVK